MRSERFDTPGYVELVVDNQCGAVEVTAIESTTTEIEVSSDHDGSDFVRSTRIEGRAARGGMHILVHVPHRKHRFLSSEDVRVSVRLPLAADLVVRAVTADVDAAGVFGKVDIDTASGDVDVDEGGEVRLKSASGNLSVGAAQALHARSASGDLLVGRLVDRSSMQTTSGNLRVGGAATEVRMETVSGSLAVDVAERGLSARSVSGDVRVSCVANGEVVVQTVSGDVEVGVAPRRSVEVDAQSLSGHLSSEIDLDGGPGVVGGEPAGRVRVKFNSVSGDLRLVRAAEPEPARSAWAAVSPDDDQAPAAAPEPAPVPAGAEPPNAAETEPPAEVAAELPPSELPPAEAAGA
jgi:hypothetical protein